MAKLDERDRSDLPKRDFGLPNEKKYPMPDASHARNAKARASQQQKKGKITAQQKEQIDNRADKVLGE